MGAHHSRARNGGFCHGRAVGVLAPRRALRAELLGTWILHCQHSGRSPPAELPPRAVPSRVLAVPYRAVPCRAVPGGYRGSGSPARPVPARPALPGHAPGPGAVRREVAGAGPYRAVSYRAGPGRAGAGAAAPPEGPWPPPGTFSMAVRFQVRCAPGRDWGTPGRSPRWGRGRAVGSASSHPGQLRPTRVSSVPNRLCPKSAPSHPAAGRGELWGGRGTVPGCLLARPRRAAGRRWGLSVISSSRIKPHASVAGHRAPCPAWHRGAVGCPGHGAGSGSLVPRPAPRAGGWGWLRGGCSCSITALPGAFSLFFRIQMTLEIEVVKHSCGSHRPVPGSVALFLGIFPARRVDPASLGGTGSCWRGILIPCPVQGSVSAGMNIPMRLVCQKLLDLGKTWEKKQRVKAEGAPHRKKTQRVAPAMGKGPQPTCSA